MAARSSALSSFPNGGMTDVGPSGRVLLLSVLSMVAMGLEVISGETMVL